MLGQFGKNGPALNMHVTATGLDITVSEGAGADFRAREFSGTPTTFDATTGATIDSQVTETTAAGANTWGMGKLSSLSGSLDCGNQEPGSSTLVLTGTTPEVTIDGPLDPVRVGCNSSQQFGQSAQAFGIGVLGATRISLIVNVRATAFTVYLAGTMGHFYTSADPTASSLIPGGAQISGNALTAAGTAAAQLTIHVTGAVVCGTTTSGP